MQHIILIKSAWGDGKNNFSDYSNPFMPLVQVFQKGLHVSQRVENSVRMRVEIIMIKMMMTLQEKKKFPRGQVVRAFKHDCILKRCNSWEKSLLMLFVLVQLLFPSATNPPYTPRILRTKKIGTCVQCRYEGKLNSNSEVVRKSWKTVYNSCPETWVKLRAREKCLGQDGKPSEKCHRVLCEKTMIFGVGTSTKRRTTEKREA